MRISTYKKILDLCTSLCEALEYIQNNGEKSLLSLCITSLDSIARCLDSNVDSIRNTSLLNKLYNISVKLRNQDNIDYSELCELSVDLYNSCKYNLRYRINVLIVAELGGKWDSMDSVYRSLMSRDDCEVDVVLEPIFRKIKLEDGTIRQNVIYEDYLTDLGIKHVPFSEYDIEKKSPDLIFFSQPYESVTDEMFWPVNLSKHGKLIYVPYYSSTTIKESITHDNFTLFSSDTEKYSWRIACQSENMLAHYVKYGSRKGENIVVSGVPKWDYPLGLNKLNTPCPLEWKEKISGRKVFLWNTHFIKENQGFELFTNGVKFINYFLNNDKIALIWRPHPMMETCLKVYTPEYYDVYKQLIDVIQKSKNIIVDDSPTYDSSFVWSDALLSDYSSLIDQYIMTDKPYALLSNKTIDETIRHYNTNDNLFDFTKIFIVNSLETAEEFINSVIANNDFFIENRKYIREKYYKFADGNVGSRFVKKIIDDLKVEILGSEYISDKKKSGIIETVDALIIGSIEESNPCIKQFHKNNIGFKICDMFIDHSDKVKFDYQYFDFHSISSIGASIYVVTSKNFSSSIYDIMVNEYHIDCRKIIKFWDMYNAAVPFMVCDRVMQKPNHTKYDGIILGISHSEVGIVVDKMKAEFCNLSVSSQDLFFQLKTLEYVKTRYSDKIENLKYAVIDLYDYEYFNYDTSLSKSAIKYLSYGGYNLEPHNFNNNKSFNVKFDDAISYFKNIHNGENSRHNTDLWHNIFENAFEFSKFEYFEPNFSDLKNRFKVVTDEDIETFDYDSKVSTKIFDETIKENVDILKKIFDTLLSINPKIKIYTIIIPKYKETAIRQYKYTYKHVDYFNKIISILKEDYDFNFLDFNILSDISEHRRYYFDAAHLNYIGALKFTDLLNEIIFGDHISE